MNVVVQEKQYTAISAPANAVYSNSPFLGQQVDKVQARALFEYEGGRLVWRSKERRKRDEAGYEYYRKSSGQDPVWVVLLGPRGAQRFYMRRYLVWNWHYGETDQILIPLDGNHLNDRIENIGFGGPLPQENVTEAPAVAITEPESKFGTLCPCCGHGVNVMAADLAVQVYGIPDQQARILRAVWSGKGAPVQMERVFSEMYADDPDGGPTQDKMYKAFKVALSHLRDRLEGSGIAVETVGYRQGYRLILERKVSNA
jgi:hypothetical protein